MSTIDKFRNRLFDCAEIPHLKDYYQQSNETLSLEKDLLLVRASETYITSNMCLKYSSSITAALSDIVSQLSTIKRYYLKLKQRIQKNQFLTEKETIIQQSEEAEAIISTIQFQNAAIEEYFGFSSSPSSCFKKHPSHL